MRLHGAVYVVLNSNRTGDMSQLQKIGVPLWLFFQTMQALFLFSTSEKQFGTIDLSPAASSIIKIPKAVVEETFW